MTIRNRRRIDRTSATTADNSDLSLAAVSGPDWPFVWRTVARVGVLLLALAALPVLATWSWILVLLLGLPLIISAFGNARAFFAWAGYVLGFVAFVLLRAQADQTGISWKFAYVVSLDKLLGAGVLPTVVLQEWFRTPWLDWSMVAIYLSYFIVPPVVAIALWLTGRGLPRFVIATLLVYGAGLVVHYLVPTAPPWLASISGYAPPVDRVILLVLFPAVPEAVEAGYASSDNDVAAMPSIHIAVTTLACIGAWRFHRAVRYAAAFYLVVMTISTVYLGEHYLIDGVAGAAMALGAWVACQRLLPRYTNEDPILATGSDAPAEHPSTSPGVRPRGGRRLRV